MVRQKPVTKGHLSAKYKRLPLDIHGIHVRPRLTLIAAVCCCRAFCVSRFLITHERNYDSGQLPTISVRLLGWAPAPEAGQHTPHGGRPAPGLCHAPATKEVRGKALFPTKSVTRFVALVRPREAFAPRLYGEFSPRPMRTARPFQIKSARFRDL